MKTFLEKGGSPHSLLSLAIPITMAGVLQAGYHLADAYWVGQLGPDAVATLSLSFPFTFLVIALGSAFAVAGSALTAQYAGAGRRDMVDRVAAQSILMTAAISLVLGALGVLFAPLLLKALALPQSMHDGAVAYLRVSFVGIGFVFVYSMFQALLRAVGNTRPPLFILITTVGLNAVLNPLFIFGWGPVPALGVIGAALSTLISQAVASIMGIAILMRGRSGVTLHRKDFYLDVPYIRRAFALGFPNSIELLARAFALLLLSYLVSKYGTLAIASYGIGSTLIQIISIPIMGIALATSTLVGKNIGVGKMDHAAHAIYFGSIFSFSSLLMLGAVVWWYAPWLVEFLLLADSASVACAAEFVRIMCLTWGGIGVQLCVVAALRASGCFFSAMSLAFFSQWLVQLPVAYILANYLHLQERGIWWSFPIANIAGAIAAVIWLANGKWKAKPIIDVEVPQGLLDDVSGHAIKDTPLSPSKAEA
jgi:putative MATE family efflux protein